MSIMEQREQLRILCEATGFDWVLNIRIWLTADSFVNACIVVNATDEEYGGERPYFSYSADTPEEAAEKVIAAALKHFKTT